MSDIVRFSTATTPNPVTEYRQSVNTPDFSGLPNTLVNPDLSAVSGQPLKYWKVVTGAVQLMTSPEQAVVDEAIITANNTTAKSGASVSIDGLSGYQLRALAQLVMDEINLLRQRDVDRTTDIAASTSLADLKTRWVARSALVQRTLAQAKTAYKNYLAGTSLDE
jgi:hypothetical protein